jgi:PEP-CTERM motif
MNKPLRLAIPLVIALLTPLAALADVVDRSDVSLTAVSAYSNASHPEVVITDSKTLPPASLLEARTLVHGAGVAIQPSSQTEAFASAGVDASGHIGAGINGFFFEQSLPPNHLLALGRFSQTFTNTAAAGTAPIAAFVDTFIPAPTIHLLGVGNFFPPGRDPGLDVTAQVDAQIFTTITHADGSVELNTVLEYGMRVAREGGNGSTGDLKAELFRDASAFQLTQVIDEPNGDFQFTLDALQLQRFFVADIAPGDTLEFDYSFTAQGDTGFGETGVFAAIGDPFDLSTGAGSVTLQFDAPTAVPEPGSWMLLASGLLALRFGARANAQQRREGGAS